jgi:hypothetical protein
MFALPHPANNPSCLFGISFSSIFTYKISASGSFILTLQSKFVTISQVVIFSKSIPAITLHL